MTASSNMLIAPYDNTRNGGLEQADTKLSWLALWHFTSVLVAETAGKEFSVELFGNPYRKLCTVQYCQIAKGRKKGRRIWGVGGGVGSGGGAGAD
jgi:hypothetical protein